MHLPTADDKWVALSAAELQGLCEDSFVLDCLLFGRDGFRTEQPPNTTVLQDYDISLTDFIRIRQCCKGTIAHIPTVTQDAADRLGGFRSIDRMARRQWYQRLQRQSEDANEVCEWCTVLEDTASDTSGKQMAALVAEGFEWVSTCGPCPRWQHHHFRRERPQPLG